MIFNCFVLRSFRYIRIFLLSFCVGGRSWFRSFVKRVMKGGWICYKLFYSCLCFVVLRIVLINMVGEIELKSFIEIMVVFVDYFCVFVLYIYVVGFVYLFNLICFVWFMNCCWWKFDIFVFLDICRFILVFFLVDM